MTAKDAEPKSDAYEATGTILVNGWPGYQEGQPVPAQVVQDLGLIDQGLVKKV